MGVSWKRPERTRSVAYLPCYKLKLEVKHLVLCSRKCKTKSLPCTAFNVPSVITTLAEHGFGGNFGWQSSPTSNVPSLLNTRLNTKKRLPLQKQILIKQ